MKIEKGWVEICSNYNNDTHWEWLCNLTGLFYLELSPCFGFGYKEIYYDGWNYSLRLGLIRVSWEK